MGKVEDQILLAEELAERLTQESGGQDSFSIRDILDALAAVGMALVRDNQTANAAFQRMLKPVNEAGSHPRDPLSYS